MLTTTPKSQPNRNNKTLPRSNQNLLGKKQNPDLLLQPFILGNLLHLNNRVFALHHFALRDLAVLPLLLSDRLLPSSLELPALQLLSPRAKKRLIYTESK